jgi:hypothetical protein
MTPESKRINKTSSVPVWQFCRSETQRTRHKKKVANRLCHNAVRTETQDSCKDDFAGKENGSCRLSPFCIIKLQGPLQVWVLKRRNSWARTGAGYRVVVAMWNYLTSKYHMPAHKNKTEIQL